MCRRVKIDRNRAIFPIAFIIEVIDRKAVQIIAGTASVSTVESPKGIWVMGERGGDDLLTFAWLNMTAFEPITDTRIFDHSLSSNLVVEAAYWRLIFGVFFCNLRS
ncbi:hypothetical protein QW180_10335 [Vibrio sinaloensis]|nr:hypothetical protein [Vibrio sinaloensis]